MNVNITKDKEDVVLCTVNNLYSYFIPTGEKKLMINASSLSGFTQMQSYWHFFYHFVGL